MVAALSLIPLLALQASSISSVLVSGRVVTPGRNPIPSDPIMESLITGKFNPPVEGEGWTRVSAKEDGWIESRSFGGAYAYAAVESPEEKTVLLDAAGHSLVYVNGVPRAGDPYGYDYMTLPIRLRKGRNDLLYVVGRGRLKTAIRPVVKPIEFDLRDATLPDVIPTDKGHLLGSVVIRNANDAPASGLSIEVASTGGKPRRTRVPVVLGESIRKVAMEIPVPPGVAGNEVNLTLKLIQGRKVVDEQATKLRFRQTNQNHKRTYVSRIDGSVQYCVVNPAQKPGPKNHLVLSVHGASVEATSQADAYVSKDDTTVVAATNRRPYGFDWEDWGRIDALEVLEFAKRTVPHDPQSIHITGHSMGGHGTWYLGTMYPSLFASVSPSAGWISFWSYGGGWSPDNPTATQSILRRSMRSMDVLGRLTNTMAQGLFVLHGDADESVPVEEARKMREEILKLKHPDFGYHEVPGGSHWYSNAAVDWPDIFNLVRRRRLDPAPARIDFTTQNPAVSSKAWWAEVDQQIIQLEPSRINLERTEVANGTWRIDGSTQNVRRIRFDLPKGKQIANVFLDGKLVMPQSMSSAMVLTKTPAGWREAEEPGQKSAGRSGPFKQAYDRKMIFVYGTTGTHEENQWSLNRARYDAESWYYRGNGSVDVLPDTAVGTRNDRNLILYGNADSNRLVKQLLTKAPIRIEKGQASVASKTVEGDLGALFLYPRGADQLIGVVGGTSLAGMRRTDRLPIILAGTAYPDWFLVDDKGIVGNGFFDHAWQVDESQSAWR